MERLDKILHGIFVGSVITAGAIGAYWKIKSDKKPKKVYVSSNTYSATGTGFGTWSTSYPHFASGDTTNASKSTPKN